MSHLLKGHSLALCLVLGISVRSVFLRVSVWGLFRLGSATVAATKSGHAGCQPPNFPSVQLRIMTPYIAYPLFSFLIPIRIYSCNSLTLFSSATLRHQLRQIFGRLTQWRECYLHTVEVTGSNPVSPKKLLFPACHYRVLPSHGRTHFAMIEIWDYEQT